MIICDKCGYTELDNSSFCSECGNAILRRLMEIPIQSQPKINRQLHNLTESKKIILKVENSSALAKSFWRLNNPYVWLVALLLPLLLIGKHFLIDASVSLPDYLSCNFDSYPNTYSEGTLIMTLNKQSGAPGFSNNKTRVMSIGTGVGSNKEWIMNFNSLLDINTGQFIPNSGFNIKLRALELNGKDHYVVEAIFSKQGMSDSMKLLNCLGQIRK